MHREIERIVREWKKESKCPGIIQVGVYATFRDTIRICTSRPGYLIGKGGWLYNKYLEKLKEINPNLEKIEFVETEYYYIK